MSTDASRDMFWTGLPAGDEHEKVCREGKDFIVVDLDTHYPNPGISQLVVFPETSREETVRFLNAFNWHTWIRVRAMTMQEAYDREADARDQHDEYNLSRLWTRDNNHARSH